MVKLAADFNIKTNRLTGSLPTELGGGLGELQIDFKVNDNSLSGRLCTELGLMNIYQDMRLNVNKLTGRIPTQLGKLVGFVKILKCHTSHPP